MRTTIYLIRHAEAESNIDPHHVGDAYLTEEGVVQLRCLVNRLKGKDIDNVYVSGVLRARLTAEEISKSIGKISTVLNFLKERSGTYTDDLLFVPNESFDDFAVRLSEAKLFLENLTEGHLVVVSHAIFIKTLIAYLMLGELLDERIISNIADTLVVDHATISKLVFNKEKGKWRVMSLNSTG